MSSSGRSRAYRILTAIELPAVVGRDFDPHPVSLPAGRGAATAHHRPITSLITNIRLAAVDLLGDPTPFQDHTVIQ
jgi:hypothetical protein